MTRWGRCLYLFFGTSVTLVQGCLKDEGKEEEQEAKGKEEKEGGQNDEDRRNPASPLVICNSQVGSEERCKIPGKI